MNWRRWLRVGVLSASLTLLIFLSGCIGPMEAIVVAPEVAEMANVKTIALLRFDDYTYEGIGLKLTEEVRDALSASYSCVDIFYAHGVLSSMGMTQEELLIPEKAMKYGAQVKADAIILGEIVDYFADASMDRPREVKKYDDGRHDWVVDQETYVKVVMRGRVIETKTGRMIYNGRVIGEGRDITRFALDYKGEPPVPQMFIPEPTKKMIPYVKERAIDDAATNFTSKLLPRTRWVPVKK